jgi:putative transcriptional regulator
LLVAAPPLGDPNFDRTVVYLLEHGADGAVGLVINRLDDPFPDDLDAWEGLVSAPQQLFYGGPVDPHALIGIARTATTPSAEQPDDDAETGWSAVTADLVSVDLARSPFSLDLELAALRVFRGYSGWGPLQLEGELALDAWIVVDAIDSDIFDADPTGLWRRVLARQGGRLAMLAKAPDDLELN